MRALANPTMPAEYDLDWSKARPNPYAARLKDTVAVVLEPDVAEAFPTSKSVNTFLRSVLAALPRRARTAGRKKGQHPGKAGQQRVEPDERTIVSPTPRPQANAVFDCFEEEMRTRRLTPTSILSAAEVREVVQGIRTVFGDEFVALAERHGIDLEASVRFDPLAKRCSARRGELGWSVREVAEALHVPQYRLKAIESGRSKEILPEILHAYVSHLGLESWYRRWAKANPDVAARHVSQGRSRKR